MNLSRYNQPLPPRLGQLLLFLNAAVAIVAGHSLVTNNPQTAAYVALAAGLLNQAVHIFIGQNPTHEQTTDSTLSNRRERVRKEKGQTRSNRKGGAA
ncbi:hypothetical protein BWI97_14230 [Siphonobacter sp. BAB-5405]|uniref:hypothetical protein n=1 Tax=Siphonobacter sp. BAB-5405 TaxID=1864825 RepID=UPI000C7F8075|nr:hypothetical protein [Siphonobacter sp. BAB-5405]PMD95509.1 hypothetical protein BWI97_14230 [Siphonobacter sp. BAB-5405]